MSDDGFKYINPNVPNAKALHLAIFGGFEMSGGGNCGNCHGTGRTIFVDPSDGQHKDIPCMACQGSGQSRA